MASSACADYVRWLELIQGHRLFHVFTSDTQSLAAFTRVQVPRVRFPEPTLRVFSRFQDVLQPVHPEESQDPTQRGMKSSCSPPEWARSSAFHPFLQHSASRSAYLALFLELPPRGQLTEEAPPESSQNESKKKESVGGFSV